MYVPTQSNNNNNYNAIGYSTYYNRELFPIATNANGGSDADPSHYPEAIVGSLGLPVIVLTSVVACLTFWRRTFNKSTHRQRNAEDPVRCIKMNILSSNGSETTTTTVKQIYPMTLKQFQNYCEELRIGKFCQLRTEFERLKINDLPNACVGELGINRSKNRFVNVLPYDHNRVVLESKDGDHDYINANFISGHHSSKEYIATQGPLKNTINDFWKMCWQHGVKSIVMLTTCHDKDREKCVRYWNSSSLPVMYGDIEVQIIKETLDSFNFTQQWIITDLVMRSGNEERSIRHYQFITWPDFGIVDPPEALVHFVRKVREHSPYPDSEMDQDYPPIVVHCSAGVGRSGTFIAVDILIQQINKLKQVDIYGCVQRMRRERMWMVQTEDQYVLIYKCAEGILKESDAKERYGSILSDNSEPVLTKEELEDRFDISLDYEIEMIASGKFAALGIPKFSF